MSKAHVGHKEIAAFAADRVNLPQERANEYRAQARRLREKLQSYIADHPDFSLRKMILSGSLAKGTALKSLNDIDVSLYVSADDAPESIDALLDHIIDRIQKAYSFDPDQVSRNTYSVTVKFKSSGLNVDLVPILYYGDKNWYGDLINQDDGSFLKTSIPRHLEFIKTRKDRHPSDFVQVIRLAKFWAARKKIESQNEFRFKSFMIELIFAHLSDQGCDFSDYPEALQQFFTYIIKSDMNRLIAFQDYFDTANLAEPNCPVKIIDPVNLENVVSDLYTENQARLIVEAAEEAGDAIDAAEFSTTKSETVYYWKKVFGPTFQG